MTTQEKSLEELGRRAVACKRWRWMPGMRALVGPSGAPYRYVTPEYAPPEGENVGFCDPIPDLSDPATLGCLLHVVREAYADYLISTVYDSAYWFVEHPEGMLSQNNTEAEALVSALEAAP